MTRVANDLLVNPTSSCSLMARNPFSGFKLARKSIKERIC